MNINFTLIIQMLVFAAFVWFTMRFVWPPLVKAMDDRQAKIAEGLDAAARGQRELELTQKKIISDLKEAKSQAADILDKANHRAAQILEEVKESSRQEGQHLIKLAQDQIQQDIKRAQAALQNQVAALVVSAAEKILKREIDASSDRALFDNLMEEI